MTQGIFSRTTTELTVQPGSEDGIKIITGTASTHEFRIIEANFDFLRILEPNTGLTLEEIWESTSQQQTVQKALLPLIGGSQLISSDSLSIPSSHQQLITSSAKALSLPFSNPYRLDVESRNDEASVIMSRFVVFTPILLNHNENHLAIPQSSLVRMYGGVLSKIEGRFQTLIESDASESSDALLLFEEGARAVLDDFGEAALPIIGNLIFAGSLAPDIISSLLRSAASIHSSSTLDALYELLTRALESSTAGVRYAAVEALSTIAGQRAKSLLKERLRREQNRTVKAAIRMAI